MLSKQAIIEFKEVYKRQLGVDLPDDEAETKALDLLKFMKILYKPIPKMDEVVER